MKKKPIWLVWVMLILTASCVSTIELKLYTPPELALAPHLKKLGILDHSQRDDPNVAGDAQFVSIQLPKNGELIDPGFLSFSAIVSAADFAKEHADSLDAVKIDLQLRRPLPDSFPPPMSKAVLEPLCKTYSLDGLLVLEYFKTGFSDMPREIGLAERYKKGSLTVGWRIYDAKDYSVVFEDVFLQELPYVPYFDEKRLGKSDRKIRQAAIMELGTRAGSTIISILTRTHIEEQRRLFTNKFGPTKDIASNMKKAGEYADEDNWAAAMDLWNPVASHRGYGIACGKAAYNMAVGCEHIGNLELALKWARIAQTQGIPIAAEYLDLLKYRAGEFE